MVVKTVLIGALMFLFATFAAQNAANIKVEFLTWEFEMRRIIPMVLSAVIGITVGSWPASSCVVPSIVSRGKVAMYAIPVVNAGRSISGRKNAGHVGL